MKKHQIKLFFTVNAAHFSLLSKRETQPFSWECYTQKQQCSKKEGKISNFYVPTLDVVFRQIEIVLKDSTAFVYVTKSEKSSHFTLMT